MGKCSFLEQTSTCDPSNRLSWINMSPVLRVSTHIYGVSQERHRKIFIFQVKPRHVTPQINCLGKNEPCSEVSTHIYGFPWT